MSYSIPIREVLDYYQASQPGPRNGWQTIRCPFHEDRSASARVNYDKEKFRCFVCNIDGDAIDIVSWREGKDFPSTVEFIEGFIGAEVSDLQQATSGGKSGSRKRTPLSDEQPARIDRRQRTLLPTGNRRRPLAGG